MANEHAIQATGTFVVSKGFRLLTKLAASQGSLQFTRAAVGTGKPPEGYSPESMIGLNAYKIDAEIADYGVQDDMAYITVQVSSDNVTEGFLVTEVGVFAEDPDEGEILYGYMDISTDPTYIYANGSTNRSKFAEFTLYVLVGSVSNVIAAVTPGSIITRDTFTAANLKAIDTHGILGGEAGAETTGQGLIDALTNKLLTEFVTNTVLMERLGTYVLKSKIVNDFLSTDEETVLSGPMGKLLKEQLNVLNTKITDFDSRIHIDDTTTIANLSAQIKTGFQCVYLKSANLKPNYGHGVILELNNASGLYAIRIISWDDDTPNIGMYYGIKLSPSTLIKDVSYFSLQVNR
ncbi:hypothetical protein [Enterocloster clostridioformis]|uniref:hypothetical protein n=1 Tax=Enterocloster clostridioformis TaxID=1531 RepID=UPI0034A1D4D4